MTEQTAQTQEPRLDWRARILSRPDMILDDRDLMRALLAANERQMGGNVVDMRGLAMARLEARLDRLEDTHRSVVAAAYENLAGTNQIHRSVLHLLECTDPVALFDALAGEVREMLRVDAIRIALEGGGAASHALLASVPEGFVRAYATAGRDAPLRPVMLRPSPAASDMLYGEAAPAMASEALMPLDLGARRGPGLLVMASADPKMFQASQGTELLTFLSGCIERLLRAALG